MKFSVKDIVKKELCIGCGICAVLCPKQILEIKWNQYGEYNVMEMAPCLKECGLCIKVCPFGDTNNEDDIGKCLYGPIPNMNYSSETGYYLNAYVGHSDEEHRNPGSSGGMATWVLEMLLKKKIVDYAICVTPVDEQEKLFSYKIIDTPEGVRNGAGSVYYPVEMSEVIRHVLNNPARYVLIGLPCFIKAIRQAQIHNRILNERIVITLGLVCGQMKSRYFTEYIATLAGNTGKIKKVRYRCKNPDQQANNFYYTFSKEDGTDNIIFWTDGISEAWVNRWFTPKACNYYDDIFAECADAVFMDAWLPEFMKDSSGTSIILIRSMVISEILNEGIDSQKIFLKKIPVEKVIQSQYSVIQNKRHYLSFRLYLDQQRAWNHHVNESYL